MHLVGQIRERERRALLGCRLALRDEIRQRADATSRHNRRPVGLVGSQVAESVRRAPPCSRRSMDDEVDQRLKGARLRNRPAVLI